LFTKIPTVSTLFGSCVRIFAAALCVRKARSFIEIEAEEVAPASHGGESVGRVGDTADFDADHGGLLGFRVAA